MLFVLILILVACLYIFLLFFLSINSSLMNLCSNIFPVLFLHAMHVSWKTWTFGISVFVARPKKLSMWQCSQPHHAIQLDTWTTSSDFDWLVWWLFVISLIALIAWTIWFCLLLCGWGHNNWWCFSRNVEYDDVHPNHLFVCDVEVGYLVFYLCIYIFLVINPSVFFLFYRKPMFFLFVIFKYKKTFIIYLFFKLS